MTITDKEAVKIVKSIKCYEVKESIETYPEDERGDKTDLEIIRDEIEYFVYMFEEVDGCYKDDLDKSREILRRTKNGRVMPVYMPSLEPVYQSYQVENAKNTVSEYRQLKSLLKKLKEV